MTEEDHAYADWDEIHEHDEAQCRLRHNNTTHGPRDPDYIHEDDEDE